MDSPVATLKWEIFVNKIKTVDELQTRLEILTWAQQCFFDYEHFDAMSKLERNRIAGLIDEQQKESGGIQWLWFGNMKPNGRFFQAVNQNNPHLSKALDQIPFDGMVVKNDYNRFMNQFLKVPFKKPLATCSRLLAMKRPDVFLCIDSKNIKNFCADVGIKESKLNYETYWEEVVCKIKKSTWYHVPQPQNELEKLIHQFRAALLDCFYYNYHLD